MADPSVTVPLLDPGPPVRRPPVRGATGPLAAARRLRLIQSVGLGGPTDWTGLRPLRPLRLPASQGCGPASPEAFGLSAPTARDSRSPASSVPPSAVPPFRWFSGLPAPWGSGSASRGVRRLRTAGGDQPRPFGPRSAGFSSVFRFPDTPGPPAMGPSGRLSRPLAPRVRRALGPASSGPPVLWPAGIGPTTDGPGGPPTRRPPAPRRAGAARPPFDEPPTPRIRLRMQGHALAVRHPPFPKAIPSSER